MHRHEQRLPVTTVPQRLKPSHAQEVYGTAEAVPFVQIGLSENLIWTSLTSAAIPPAGLTLNGISAVLTQTLKAYSLLGLNGPTKVGP